MSVNIPTEVAMNEEFDGACKVTTTLVCESMIAGVDGPDMVTHDGEYLDPAKTVVMTRQFG